MIKTKELPTQERLQYLFYYNPKTGKLYTRFKYKGHPIGRTGSIHKSLGYTTIGVDGLRYLVSRLIWVYINGSIPEGMYIDHIDCNRNNNRIDNLRLVTIQENNHNRKTIKGYSYDKQSCKYYAEITNKAIRHSLGYYDTPEEARTAYLKAKKTLHPTSPIND